MHFLVVLPPNNPEQDMNKRKKDFLDSGIVKRSFEISERVRAHSPRWQILNIWLEHF